MNHDVFISYSSQNNVVAKAICHVLEQNGIRCWIAPRDIPPGTEYGDLIDEAIKKSKVVVVLFSETAAVSQWVKGEMNIAFEEQKVIIPFRLDKTPLSGQNRVILNQKHWIDAFPDYENKFSDLVSAVAKAIGKNVVSGAAVESKKEKPKVKLKTVVASVIALVVVVLVVLCFPLVSSMLHEYTYDREGLHVKVKGITEAQEKALTSVMDNMVLVEGGSFIMGNNYSQMDYFTELDSLSVNPHKVELGKFYICKYEVTQKEWEAFLDLDGKCIEPGENKAMDMLSWEDAKQFADTLARLTGLDFSLPTEAQWEYAARGGKKTKGYVFAGNSYDVTEVAWTSFDELKSAHDVGGKRYNELGLYDMSGNVSEWCLDYFALYEKADAVNPKGPEKGMDKVLRGGDFKTENPFDLKTTTRYYTSPFVNRKGSGMRLVINVKE